LFLSPIILFALEFKVATYNVENLFDAKKSGHEYREYIPNTKYGWNKKMLSIKIKNISKVIKGLDADVLALHEIENKEVLKKLNQALGNKKYPYIYIPHKTSNINSALLSRFPIIKYKEYKVIKRFRPIYELTLNIDKKKIKIFINHWPAYKNGNKKRMQYAKALKKLYQNEDDFILLGDFNSPLYENKKGWGKSISYILNKNYDLWYEVPYKKRYSYAFFKTKSAIDHIIVSKNRYKKFYKKSSFHVFMPNYLVNKYKNPIRWKISKKGKGKHLGVGYSDHLPIIATFDTKAIKSEKISNATILKLLHVRQSRVNYLLEDVMIIDKNRYGVTIEDKNKSTIFIYKPDGKFTLGEICNLHVRQMAYYKGKREIILVKKVDR